MSRLRLKKPLVSEANDQERFPTARGFHGFYRAAPPLSSKTLTYVSGIIRRPEGDRQHLAEAEPGQQALLVLVHLKKGETFPEVAAGFGVGTVTAWRYVNETVAPLLGRAPRLRKAVRDAQKAGYPYVVIDGTLIAIDRVAADRPFYSGKHKKHGMNLQVSPVPMARSCGSPGRCPARCTTGRPNGSGACWTNTITARRAVSPG